MSLETCKLCDRNILTEADPYLVFPHNSGYHLICLDCVGESSSITIYRRLLKLIKKGITNG